MRGETVTAEMELFTQYIETGDKKIRDELVNNYTYIAKILAHRFNGCGVEFEDIYQVACMGIILAVERFNPNRGVQFATFATPTVLGEIRRFLRDKAKCIKVPRKMYEIFCKAENLRKQSENVSMEELARLLDMPVETIHEAYKAGDSAFIKSLEDEAYTDGGLSLANMVGVDEDGFTLVENADFVNYCMSKLDEKEIKLIRARFYDEKPQSAIAGEWGVSQMYISRLEKKVIEKLKRIYLND
ncbi:MAG: sigma-70 family RNA polymerase sigma factor [Ruminococcaceae bacterium]|nr:sigma-70 family RNA polymerase sigma factor [Oscillospiraceae bacterium]